MENMHVQLFDEDGDGVVITVKDNCLIDLDPRILENQAVEQTLATLRGTLGVIYTSGDIFNVIFIVDAVH